MIPLSFSYANGVLTHMSLDPEGRDTVTIARRVANIKRVGQASLMKLETQDWTVEFDPKGGAIRRAVWRGQDILRPYSPDWDPFPAVCQGNFPLVPYSNRIPEGRFTFEGQTYQLPSFRPGDRHALHGVGWLADWTVETEGDDVATLTLDYDGPAWPWRFTAKQRIWVEEGLLNFQMTYTNTDDRAQPVGLGFHPYFPRDTDTWLDFYAEGIWVGEIAGLSEERLSLPEKWYFKGGMELTEEQIDHCFDQWERWAVIAWPSRNLKVFITADEALDHFVLFTPTGEDFLCFEPVSHMSNAISFLDKSIETGLKVLQPGERYSVSMKLNPKRIEG